MTIQEQIQQQIQSQPVVLYMKGTKDFPQCGFSGRAVQILRDHGVNFLDINVLEDPEVRQGIKDFANWPTIPQLYIKGEFVGGCDIMNEIHANGELKELLSTLS